MNLYMTAGSAVLFVYPTKKKKKNSIHPIESKLYEDK